MISIITSLYKSENYLPSFLNNIQKASRDLDRFGIPHEFIILPNDISLVETKLLESASLKNKNIVSINRKRESLYATWNFGISQAKYSVITFWNVDDIRFSTAIKEALNKIKADDPVITYFPFLYKRYVKIFNLDFLIKRKVINPPEFDHLKFEKEMHIGPFFITTKKTFELNGLFDETFYIAGDYDWSTRAAKNNIPFLKINNIAGIFKNNGKSLSGKKDTKQFAENQRVLHSIK